MNKKGFVLPLAIMVGSAVIVALFLWISAEQRDTGVIEKPAKTVVSECEPTGCSSTACKEKGQEVATTCQIEDWYSCYSYSKCERQKNGKCGWTVTSEYDNCMQEKNPFYRK